MSSRESNLWERLVDEVGEAEIESAANVSVEQAEVELAAAGIDVPAERANANAFLDALASGTFEDPRDADHVEVPAPRPTTAVVAVAQEAAPRSVRQDRRRPRPVVMWLAVAATATVAAGALYAVLQPRQLAPVVPEPTAATPPPVQSAEPNLVAAADLRRQAAAACDAQQWSVCLAHLDEARAVDPGGDDTPTVRATRDRALRGVREKPNP
jgi:hypothetical protein